MRAMILAAGKGTRLLPLTEKLPKALVPVAGKPMIHYGLDLLARHGISEVMINLHHLGSLIEEALGDGSDFGLRISYSREDELLDTGGGIKRAASFFQRKRFLVMNCDFLARIDLHELLAWHRERGGIATLVLREDPDMDRYGTIDIDAKGRISRILSWGKAGGHTRMFAGVQVLEPGVFEWMKSSAPFGITRDTYPLMLEQGAPLWGYDFPGPWFDLGTHEGIRRAEIALLEERKSHGEEGMGGR